MNTTNHTNRPTKIVVYAPGTTLDLADVIESLADLGATWPHPSADDCKRAFAALADAQRVGLLSPAVAGNLGALAYMSGRYAQLSANRRLANSAAR